MRRWYSHSRSIGVIAVAVVVVVVVLVVVVVVMVVVVVVVVVVVAAVMVVGVVAVFTCVTSHSIAAAAIGFRLAQYNNPCRPCAIGTFRQSTPHKPHHNVFSRRTHSSSSSSSSSSSNNRNATSNDSGRNSAMSQSVAAAASYLVLRSGRRNEGQPLERDVIRDVGHCSDAVAVLT